MIGFVRDTTVSKYEFEIDYVKSFFPITKSKNFAGYNSQISVPIVDSLVTAEDIGTEKMNSLAQFYRRNKIPTTRQQLKASNLLPGE